MKRIKIIISLLILTCLMTLVACKAPIEQELKNENQAIDVETEKMTDVAKRPMVKVDGEIYMDMGYIDSCVKCGTEDGTIKSSVKSTEEPKNDDESNFGEGYDYQFAYEGTLRVKIEDRWHIFQNIKLDSSEIPEGVANFKAKVLEVNGDMLLVSLSDIGEEFNWIFGFNDVGQIKPILLPLDNLSLEGKDKELSLEDLVGKTLQVWFDGQIENEEMEMSNPIDLGQVYRISLIEEEK